MNYKKKIKAACPSKALKAPKGKSYKTTYKIRDLK